MYELTQTVIEGHKGKFEEVQDFFEEQGYVIGGGWEYDHGFFDKQLEGQGGYLFVRIPAYVEKGAFGERHAVLRLGAPFILRHQYQAGNDDDVSINVVNAAINQFSEPQDADASLSEDDIQKGEGEVRRLEQEFQLE